MLNAVRSVSRTQHNQSFHSYSLCNHIIIKRISSGVGFVQSGSGRPNQHESSCKMDPKQSPEYKTRDTMSSFGEAYATRSDDEGFGGIYGGNQYLHKDTEDKNAHGEAPELERNQGSEVKEKEKARNQTKVPS
ncbi:hypothetical protein OROMI_023888 [Orobanche minor]